MRSVMDKEVGIMVAHGFEEGEEIDKRWIVKMLLGCGKTSAVFEVKDKFSGLRHAMKIELSCLGFSLLREEVAALKALNNSNARHTCSFIAAAELGTCNYVVMSLVGPDLNALLNSFLMDYPDGNTKFSLYTCIYTAKHSLMAIQELHQCGLVHGDVNPDNFAIGRPPHQRSIFILDFGMCRKYRNDRRTKGRKKIEFRGNPFYSSVRSLRFNEHSKCDDLWSWFFMVTRMTSGRLPWRKWKYSNNVSLNKALNQYADMKEKAVRNTDSFVTDCPEEYKKIMDTIRKLRDNDYPPYGEFLRILAALRKRMGYWKARPLDWEPPGIQDA